MAQDRVTLWKVILDFVVLACVAFPLLALSLWVEPFERGYFNNDLSIRLPYRKQAISEALLAGVGFAIIVVTVLAVEIVRDRSGKGFGAKYLVGASFPAWVWESYNTIGVFTFGAACQQLIINLAKYAIGRLRPHFYDVCRPIPAISSVDDVTYITDYTCAGTDEYLIKDMRLSFPSGHSGFAMYCAIFFIFYIQIKGKWRGSKLLRHGVQYAMVMGAWYVGLSRVQDNMHHWSDVTVGFIVGAVTAILVFLFVLKPKKYRSLTWQEPMPITNILPRPVLAA